MTKAFPALAVKKITSQPLKLVINSGGQDHRWLGNGYFAGLGLETLAHADAQADMKARAGEQMKGLKVLKERLDGTIDMGGTLIELKHRQGGHTPGGTLVWLPQLANQTYLEMERE